MLAEMLGRHPDITALPELHFFEQLWMPVDAMKTVPLDQAFALTERLLHHARDGYFRPYEPGAHATEARHLVSSIPGGRRSKVALYRAVVEACAVGASCAVDHTPRYVYWVEELLHLFPDACVLFVVRDPRDVALSQRRWGRSLLRSDVVPWRIGLRHWLQYHPILVGLLWRSAATTDVAPDRIFAVRFEQVIDAPEEALRPFLAAAGAEWHPIMASVSHNNSSNHSDARPGVGLQPAAAGRGVRDLDPTTLWLVDKVTAVQRERWGYASSGARPTSLGLLRQGASLPVKVLIAVVLSATRTRSILAAARRRLAA